MYPRGKMLLCRWNRSAAPYLKRVFNSNIMKISTQVIKATRTECISFNSIAIEPRFASVAALLADFIDITSFFVG